MSNIGTMSNHIEQKLKKFIKLSIPGTVCLAQWLEEVGISRDLQKRYKKSGWLVPIGTGAFIKIGDKVEWQGGIYSIQSQLKTLIYPGALTAIAMQGGAHYIRMGRENLYLFAPLHTKLPKWFKDCEWEVNIRFHQSNFLPAGLGLNDYEVKDFKIKLSSLERAILECLHLTPNKVDLVECYQIMEGLVTLRPKLLQELLEGCTSIKVIRLFLYMAKKANHPWYKHLNKEKFNIGAGDRSIVKNGVYIASHKITIPRELSEL